ERQFGWCVVSAAGQDFRRLNRSNVNDTPCATFSECAAAEYLRAEPRRAQVDVYEPRPLRVGQLEKRHDGFDAGIVDEHIQAAELTPGGIDHWLDLAPIRDVADHSDRVPPLRAHGRYDFIDASGIELVDGDVGSFVGKDLGNAATDASPGAGHEGLFSLETHRLILER